MSVKENFKDNVKIKEEIKIKIAPPKQYRVELANNNTTAHDAVIDVLVNVFEHSRQRAYQIMVHAEMRGFAICYISTKEMCEEKKVQAEAYCFGKAGETGMGFGGSANYEDLVFTVDEHEN